MEYANTPRSGAASQQYIRVATHEDVRDITHLLRNAPYIHLHVDWRLPVDWIGEPIFLVQPTEQPKKNSPFAGYQPTLQSCLAITADPRPSAWVRAVAVGKVTVLSAALEALFAHALDELRNEGIREVGWLTAEKWPTEFLPALGFAQISEIEAYFKPDLLLPGAMTPRDEVTIRPVETADFSQLAALEEAVFAPLWRHSAETLALAHRESVSFDVMEKDGRLLGFQFSTGRRNTAHLVRMVLDPTVQGQGYGSYLLQTTLMGYKEKRLKNVTLNTQVENVAARRLYEKFGFSGTGQRLPIWATML